MTEPAPEGSVLRRNARIILIEQAIFFYSKDKSFAEWMDALEAEDLDLLYLVSQRDLDSIFQMVWKLKFFPRLVFPPPSEVGA